MKNIGAINLSDSQFKTQTQLFIEAYRQIKSQGALDEEKIMEVAQDMVKEKMRDRYESQKDSKWSSESENIEPMGLVESFLEASKENKEKKTSQSTIDIKSLLD